MLIAVVTSNAYTLCGNRVYLMVSLCNIDEYICRSDDVLVYSNYVLNLGCLHPVACVRSGDVRFFFVYALILGVCILLRV
jgi:hypothetical protein